MYNYKTKSFVIIPLSANQLYSFEKFFARNYPINVSLKKMALTSKLRD